MSIKGNGRKPDGTFGEGNKAAAGRRTALREARAVFAKDASRAEEVLRAMLDDGRKPELQFAAAKLILEYHFGKPRQTTELAADSSVGEFTVNLTTRPKEELLGRLRGLVDRETADTP